MPVASSSDKRFARSRAGFGSGGMRVAQMKAAETKKEIASMMNAVFLPNRSVTAPPNAAPKASVTDHVAPPRAFAAINSARLTIIGTAADSAGSKNDERMTSNAEST